jgi:hypothetical protein
MANPPAGFQVQFSDGDRLHVHIVTHFVHEKESHLTPPAGWLKGNVTASQTFASWNEIASWSGRLRGCGPLHGLDLNQRLAVLVHCEAEEDHQAPLARAFRRDCDWFDSVPTSDVSR